MNGILHWSEIYEALGECQHCLPSTTSLTTSLISHAFCEEQELEVYVIKHNLQIL